MNSSDYEGRLEELSNITKKEVEEKPAKNLKKMTMEKLNKIKELYEKDGIEMPEEFKKRLEEKVKEEIKE